MRAVCLEFAAAHSVEKGPQGGGSIDAFPLSVVGTYFPIVVDSLL